MMRPCARISSSPLRAQMVQLCGGSLAACAVNNTSLSYMNLDVSISAGKVGVEGNQGLIERSTP